MDLTLNSAAIPDEPFAIAFSGGGDSTALLHALRGRKPVVLIVDHGLREDSAGEAKKAQAFSQSLGLETKVLTWSPPPMTTGLQAKARQARYGLIGDMCRARGLKSVLTGHTEDDQAETVLMRLQAGGTWRGAAGMRTVTPSPLWPQLAEVNLCRPMLGMSRADIRTYLKSHHLPFINDPSNENRDFSRIRARQELKHSPVIRRDMLELAGQMHEGRTQEDHRLASFLGAHVKDDEFGNLFFKTLPPPRLLSNLIRAVSGTGERPKSRSLTRLRMAIQDPEFKGATLGGVAVTPFKTGFALIRDPVVATGRRDILPLKPQNFKGHMLWDGRFWVEGQGTLTPTGTSWRQAPPPLLKALKSCPAPARASLPMWTQGGQLVGIGPYGLDGQRLVQVKSAVFPRLESELACG